MSANEVKKQTAPTPGDSKRVPSPTAALTEQQGTGICNCFPFAASKRASNKDRAVVGLSGALDLKTYKGEVRAGFTHLSGAVHAETFKGDVTLTFPSDSAFELSADAGKKGEIVSDFEGTGPIRSSRRSGLRSSATVNGGGPRVTLSTDKGKLSVRRS